MSRRIVITGANRGIGLALVRQWTSAGHEIAALTRSLETAHELGALAADSNGRVTLHRADVGSDQSVTDAATAAANRFDAIELLVNNAGINPRQDADDFNAFSLDDARAAFEINTLGPVRVTRAFLPLLSRGTNATVVHVGSRMGSLTHDLEGGSWPYRISKTALNMVHRNLTHELDGVTSVVVHPGWVRTDMGGPHAPLSVDESASALVDLIDALGPDHHGRYLDLDGSELGW